MSSQRSDILHALNQRIEELEDNWHPRQQAPVSFGIAPLDEILGSARPSLVELLSAAEGAGAATLAFLMAGHVCGEWKTLVVIDGLGAFYPPAAKGLNLERTIVVRPRNRRDLLLATNQSLRCPAVGAVVGWCEQLRTLDARRLQLAAEAGSGVGFLLRPATARNEPSFAPLRLLVSPLASAETKRRLQIDVVRCRGDKGGQSLLLEVDHETGAVRVLPAVASAAAAARATSAAQ
jgi:hypothetical protein